MVDDSVHVARAFTKETFSPACRRQQVKQLGAALLALTLRQSPMAQIQDVKLMGEELLREPVRRVNHVSKLLSILIADPTQVLRTTYAC